jgi:hypothetical protein
MPRLPKPPRSPPQLSPSLGPSTMALSFVAAMTASMQGSCSSPSPRETAAPSDTGPEGCSSVESVLPVWNEADFSHVYDVGEGETYAEPGEVPWESLTGGTLVRIHARVEPYRSKWVVNTAATQSAPLVILGVGDVRPVISGEGAITRTELDYWNEDRSIVKIGGSSLPSGDVTPAWVVVQWLDIQNAKADDTFTDDNGEAGRYSSNAGCIDMEAGDHVTIVGNALHDCGNGLFASSATTDLHVVANHIWDNGNYMSAYEHNSYTEALGITFEFNHYGNLCDDCNGNNLKDRSAGTVIRYNWIEGGNRQLDLVDAGGEATRDDPSYAEALVYGNVLVEHDDDGNSQIVHFGGDGSDTDRYRPGPLQFYHNTIVSERPKNTTLLRLSTSAQSADVRDNVVVAAHLAVTAGAGQVDLRDNWLPSGWVETFEAAMDGTIEDLGNLGGTDPRIDPDFVPEAGSPLVDAAGDLAAEPPQWQYVRDEAGEPRPDDGTRDIGAFESCAD